MKKILILAAMLIGLSATAQEHSVDDGFMVVDTNKLCVDHLFSHVLDSMESENFYRAAGTFTIYPEPECIYYSVSNRISFKGFHETDVIVNKYYGFELVQKERSVGNFKWVTGYIYHYGIPIYQFEIDGELSVEIINQE